MKSGQLTRRYAQYLAQYLFSICCAVLILISLLLLPPFARAQGSVAITQFFGFPKAGNYPDGSLPQAPLLQASDGNFYGTTQGGGDDGSGCAVHSCFGTIFKLTPQGQFTSLHTFSFGDAAAPYANGKTPGGGVVEGQDGYLYGVTREGGFPNNGRGVVYKISKDGQQFQKLHDFCQDSTCSDGETPVGELVVGGDGALYGVVSFFRQTIYKITTGGVFTKLADLSTLPASVGTLNGGLVLASDGNFYGMGALRIYQVMPTGALSAVYTFGTIPQDGFEGSTAPMIQAADGNLYGVTYGGGANAVGIVFRISLPTLTNPSVYEKIFDLKAADTGVQPRGLVQTSDGNLWGTTTNTGNYSLVGGAVYTITTAGTLVQSTFLVANQTGAGAAAPLIQASDGKLYGTASTGGLPPGDGGTAFVVDAGLVVLQSISVSPATASVAVGSAQQFTATGHYSDNSTKDLTTSATWSSSSTSVATISNTAGTEGLATGVSAGGPVTITATSGQIHGTAQLSVTALALVSIAVTPANPSVPQGSTQPFTATGTYSDGSTQNITGSVTWASSNTAVATIALSGVASALAAGTANISAHQGSVANSTTMTVIGLQSLTISPPNPSISAGSTVQFAATVHYSDGSTQDVTPSAVWSSSKTSVATITSPGGFATGIARGSATIKAVAGALSASTTLTVSGVVLQSIAITPATASIPVGGTQQFTAIGSYSDGTTQDVSNAVSWASSPDHLVSISNTGLVTGLKRGTATIKAALKGVKASATLTVQ